MSSIYQLGCSIGCVIVVFASAWLSAAKMLVVQLVFRLVGSLIILVSQMMKISLKISWICIFMLGLGSSSLMSQCILLISKFFNLTSISMALICFAFAGGLITGPFISFLLPDMFESFAFNVMILVTVMIMWTLVLALIYVLHSTANTERIPENFEETKKLAATEMTNLVTSQRMQNGSDNAQKRNNFDNTSFE